MVVGYRGQWRDHKLSVHLVRAEKTQALNVTLVLRRGKNLEMTRIAVQCEEISLAWLSKCPPQLNAPHC